jgi:hypothetical protein
MAASPGDSAMVASPDDSIMKINNEHTTQSDDLALDKEDGPPQEKPGGKSGVFTIIVSGLALFSDGYNAQISMSITSWTNCNG